MVVKINKSQLHLTTWMNFWNTILKRNKLKNNVMSTQVQKQAKQNNYLGTETEVVKVFKRAKTNKHIKFRMVVIVGQLLLLERREAPGEAHRFIR